jgi:hypothetical protein
MNDVPIQTQQCGLALTVVHGASGPSRVFPIQADVLRGISATTLVEGLVKSLKRLLSRNQLMVTSLYQFAIPPFHFCIGDAVRA